MHVIQLNGKFGSPLPFSGAMQPLEEPLTNFLQIGRNYPSLHVPHHLLISSIIINRLIHLNLVVTIFILFFILFYFFLIQNRSQKLMLEQFWQHE